MGSSRSRDCYSPDVLCFKIDVFREDFPIRDNITKQGLGIGPLLLQHIFVPSHVKRVGVI